MRELHKHAAVFEAAMRGEADDWEVSCNTWSSDEWKPAGGYLDVLYTCTDNWNSRRKQKTHVVNGFTVPEPLLEIPSVGEFFYLEDAVKSRFFDAQIWDVREFYKFAFSRGIAHATKEGAIANCKARLGIDPYKDES